MEFSAFKSMFGVTKVGLYKSTKSDRFVGSIQTPEGIVRVSTVEGLDLKADKYVYPIALPDEETGKEVMVYFISNKKQREHDVVL